jgi:hypothetical protein
MCDTACAVQQSEKIFIARGGGLSNTHAGNDFEGAARDFFATQGMVLTKNFSAPVGVGETKKPHRFDLGSPPFWSNASRSRGRTAATCRARR